MPRHSTRDTDLQSDDEVATTGGSGGGNTIDSIAREVRAIRRGIANLDERLRNVEIWRATLDGLPGHPGRFATLDGKLAEVERDLQQQAIDMIARVDRETALRAAGDEKLSGQLAGFGKTVEKLDGIHLKILVAAGTGGATIAAVVLAALKVWGWIS